MKQVTDHKQSKNSGGGLMKYGMMACCAIMLIPIGVFLLGSGAIVGITGNLGLLALLAVCVGAHFFMHRTTGKSHHETAGEDRPDVKTGLAGAIGKPAIDSATANLVAVRQGG